jgi:hypothetical protein
MTRLSAVRLSAVRLSAAVAAAGLAGLLAGCGSVQAPGASPLRSTAADPSGALGAGSAGTVAGSGSPTTATGSSSTAGAGSSPGSGGAGAASQPCSASALRIHLDTAAAGVAAGAYYVPLDFTNTSGQACELAGYPAVAFTSGATGHQIGAEAAVDRAVKADAVHLAPGATAHAWLQVVSAASYPAGQCRPVTAAGLRVVAPGSQDAAYVAHPVPACKSAAASSQLLTVHPVQPGRARRGTA